MTFIYGECRQIFYLEITCTAAQDNYILLLSTVCDQKYYSRSDKMYYTITVILCDEGIYNTSSKTIFEKVETIVFNM